MVELEDGDSTLPLDCLFLDFFEGIENEPLFLFKPSVLKL